MTDSVSSCVKRIIDKTPFIQEMLMQGILSCSNYAQLILPQVSEACGKPVRQAAIIMAIRRYSEELRSRELVPKRYNVHYEIVMKTNIVDVNLVRRDSFIPKLGTLYENVSTEKGDFLNVSMGNHEVSLAVSEKYRKLLESVIEGEEILNRMEDLVALTLIFSGDFLQTPGIVYEAVRKLAWEDINMIEVVSTMNELTFVIKREDSMTAFSVLQGFLGAQ